MRAGGACRSGVLSAARPAGSRFAPLCANRVRIAERVGTHRQKATKIGVPVNIAVSACLLGEECRYDGTARPCPAVQALAAQHALVAVCPEAMGGLPTPRPPHEIVRDGDGERVVDATGRDGTERFREGARVALSLAQEHACELAVLKSKSPSCGSGQVYDGTFSGTLAPGWGVAARLFRDAGIRVLDEDAPELAALTEKA